MVYAWEMKHSIYVKIGQLPTDLTAGDINNMVQRAQLARLVALAIQEGKEYLR